MAERFIDDKTVREHFDRWMASPTLFDHPSDREHFYKFVKASVNYARQRSNKLWDQINMTVLEANLYDVLRNKYSQKNWEDILHKIKSKFENLIFYENTPFP